jgi:hypothetical protein
MLASLLVASGRRGAVAYFPLSIRREKKPEREKLERKKKQKNKEGMETKRNEKRKKW